VMRSLTMVRTEKKHEKNTLNFNGPREPDNRECKCEHHRPG